MKSRHSWWLALLLGGASFAQAGEKDWFVPLGPPPEAGKRRISGGEAFPPLPLPATPLRRTERKREPSPPKLIAKVVWGEDATFTYDNGGKTSIADWNLCPGDLQQLMKNASARLGMTYGADSFSLASFDGDPAKTPVLFFSGVRTIKFSPHEIELLRSYVLRGGMIVADSIAGSPYFYDSFRAAMEQAFPDFEFPQASRRSSDLSHARGRGQSELSRKIPTPPRRRWKACMSFRASACCFPHTASAAAGTATKCRC